MQMPSIHQYFESSCNFVGVKNKGNMLKEYLSLPKPAMKWSDNSWQLFENRQFGCKLWEKYKIGQTSILFLLDLVSYVDILNDYYLRNYEPYWQFLV